MATDHIQMLCDISELNELFEEESLELCLQKTVEMVAAHMLADVCSIYLYSDVDKMLVLKATVGLNQESINNVTMKPGEGLVGTAMKELRVIKEDIGKNNPLFKFIPGIDEEKYDAFLAVPIARGKYRIGVLVLQRGDNRNFNDNDVKAVKGTASQLATMLEHIKLMVSPATAGMDTEIDFKQYSFIKGKGAAAGSASGPAIHYGINRTKELISEEVFSGTFTLEDFNKALLETEKQLESLQEKVEEKLSDAASLIFASHLLMLKDRGFIGEIRELITSGENPPSAIIAIFMKYRALFSESPNQLIKEKVQDIEDITRRLLDNLLGRTGEEEMFASHIVIARDLYPSDLLKLSAENISGVILASGGVTAHVAILARSLELPMIIMDDSSILSTPEGTQLLLDADTGNLYINPPADIIATFTERDRGHREIFNDIENISRPAVTKDGSYVPVLLNINLLTDLKRVPLEAIDGVGLYRTEFPFMIRSSFPSEEEQLVIYKKLLADTGEKPVTFRTLDIGGDKILSYYEFPEEDNPFLGMRSIRFSLQHKEIFTQQIRAILRAGAGKNIRIMFPMISSIEEFSAAKAIVHQSMDDLKNDGIDYCADPAIGMMVEIPSVIATIDDLAEEADFFSVGTNDLIQYLLAVDRTNTKVADMYIPHHPAVLRSLGLIARAARKAGIDASVCGDMANKPEYIPFLLGVGINSFSVDARFIPRIKEAVSNINLQEATAGAKEILLLRTISDIEKKIFG